MKYLNAMKTNKLLAAAFVVMAATSCAKENINISEPSGNRLSINAACANTKTILQNGQDVYWTPDDIIRVFDSEGNNYEFTNSLESPAASAEFTCEKWPVGAIPQYASAFNSGYKATCTIAGVFTVRVGCEQLVSHASSFARKANASVGIVEGESGAYTISEMKNVAGLIKITFTETNKIKSLSVQAIGGEPLTGWINVDYEKLTGGDNDFWTATPNKEVLPKLTLKPSGDQKAADGSFASGEYYLPVIPQTYAKGLRFVMTNTDGEVAVRTIGKTSGFTVERNSIKSFSAAVDQGVSFSATQSPDSLVFRLGGDAWNFTTGPLAADKQDPTNGDPYTYDYYDFATGFSGAYDFKICKGSGDAYAYNANEQAIEFQTNPSWILLPAIEGYTIKSLTLAHRNSTPRNFSLIENALSTETGGNEIIGLTEIAKESTYNKTFYSDDEVKPSENTPTYLRIRTVKSYYRNITVVYAKEISKKPAKPITINFNSSTIKGLPSTNAADGTAFTISGYDFVAVDGGWKYSGGALYNAGSESGKIQFPAIEKYRLASVYVANGNSGGKTYSIRDSSGKKPDEGTDGAQKKIDSNGYTWEFKSAKENTSYFLWSHNINAKTTKLKLTYNPIEE